MPKTHLDLVVETWGSIPRYVRQVWGEAAQFNVVGKSLIIHLDRPNPKTRRERVQGFATRQQQLAHANCPLCREQASLGGDEIFDTEPVESQVS